MVSPWKSSVVRLAAALALWLPLSACSAHVEFQASAHYVCAGQPVRLTWNVTGVGTMTAKPPLTSLADGRVASEGQMTVAPIESTQIELRATRWLGSSTASVQTIHVVPGRPSAEPLTVSLADPSAGCADGRVWATVHAQKFATSVKVSVVATHPGDGRTYDVEHGGAHATLAPETTTATFAGLPVVGDWKVSSPLLPGEACGTSSLPRNLVVDVFAQCTQEGQP